MRINDSSNKMSYQVPPTLLKKQNKLMSESIHSSESNNHQRKLEMEIAVEDEDDEQLQQFK